MYFDDIISHPERPPRRRGRGRPATSTRDLARAALSHERVKANLDGDPGDLARRRAEDLNRDIELASKQTTKARKLGLLDGDVATERARWLAELDAFAVPAAQAEAIMLSTEASQELAVEHGLSVEQVEYIRSGGAHPRRHRDGRRRHHRQGARTAARHRAADQGRRSRRTQVAGGGPTAGYRWHSRSDSRTHGSPRGPRPTVTLLIPALLATAGRYEDARGALGARTEPSWLQLAGKGDLRLVRQLTRWTDHQGELPLPKTPARGQPSGHRQGHDSRGPGSGRLWPNKDRS